MMRWFLYNSKITQSNHRRVMIVGAWLFAISVLLVCFCSTGKGLIKQDDEAIGNDDLPGTLELYTDYIAKNPDAVEGYIRRGLILLRLNEYDKALKDFDHAILIDPELAGAYHCKGKVYNKTGQYDRALENFNKAFLIEPESAEILGDRGLAYYNKGDFTKALTDFNKAFAMDLYEPALFLCRGIIYYNTGKYPEAVEDFTVVLNSGTSLWDAYTYRAKTYQQIGEQKGMRLDYHRAIKVRPDDPLSYINRGLMYTKKRELILALKDFNKAIEKDSSYAMTFKYRGDVYLFQGKIDMAIADYTQAIALQPLLTTPYINRADIYYQINKPAQALEDCHQAMANAEQGPGSLFYEDALSIKYLCAGEFSQAIIRYKKLIEQYPEKPYLYDRLGEAYFRTGQEALAVENWKTAFSLHHAYPIYAHARELLGLEKNK